jgi:N6-adenosine-specific RNA methylase IME4
MAEYDAPNVFAPLPTGPFDVILADPPWAHYGSPTKDQAAGKHYDCIDAETMATLPVFDIVAPRAVLFLWATCPMLAVAIDTLRRWGFHYRGVAFVWVKTSNAGSIISGQGVRPSVVKPTTELVLCGATMRTGRPLSLRTEAMGQVVWDDGSIVTSPILAPRPGNVHSAKPDEVRHRIEALFDPLARRVELFARGRQDGWTAWGSGMDSGSGVDAGIA